MNWEGKYARKHQSNKKKTLDRLALEEGDEERERLEAEELRLVSTMMLA